MRIYQRCGGKSIHNRHFYVAEQIKLIDSIVIRTYYIVGLNNYKNDNNIALLNLSIKKTPQIETLFIKTEKMEKKLLLAC